MNIGELRSRDLMSAAAPDPERQAELLEDFAYFDTDGDGSMQFDEFVLLMDGLGADMTNEECRTGFEEIDSDRDGAIEFEEFMDWWTSP